MTSTWTPLGIDSESKVRTCFGRIYDLGEGGAVTEITGGTGISTGGTPTAPIIYNDGVLVVNAGPGIAVSGDAQTPTVSNTGVLGVSAGAGIAVSGTQSDRAIANTGVLAVSAGAGIAVSGTQADRTIVNTGVLSVTAGTGGVSVTGTAQNPVVNVSIPTLIFDTSAASYQDLNATISASNVTGFPQSEPVEYMLYVADFGPIGTLRSGRHWSIDVRTSQYSGPPGSIAVQRFRVIFYANVALPPGAAELVPLAITWGQPNGVDATVIGVSVGYTRNIPPAQDELRVTWHFKSPVLPQTLLQSTDSAFVSGWTARFLFVPGA